MATRVKVALVVLGLLVFWFAAGVAVYDTYGIASDSMSPTLRSGDKVFMRESDNPAVGDVVVFDSPEDTLSGFRVVKRVVAAGGQTVSFADGHLVVDGQRPVEPYLQEQTSTRAGIAIPGCDQERALADQCVVPEGSIFLLGDNRTGSTDSRVYGPVDISSVRGVMVEPPIWFRIDLLS